MDVSQITYSMKRHSNLKHEDHFFVSGVELSSIRERFPHLEPGAKSFFIRGLRKRRRNPMIGISFAHNAPGR